MTALTRFARLLGLPDHQAEDALHSERAARHVLTRRSFFGVSAAMAAGTVFGFVKPVARERRIAGESYSWDNIKIMLNGEALLADYVSISFHSNATNLGLPRNWKRNAGAATYSADLTLEQEVELQ